MMEYMLLSEEEVKTAIRVHVAHLIEQRDLPRPENGTRIVIMDDLHQVEVTWHKRRAE